MFPTICLYKVLKFCSSFLPQAESDVKAHSPLKFFTCTVDLSDFERFLCPSRAGDAASSLLDVTGRFSTLNGKMFNTLKAKSGSLEWNPVKVQTVCTSTQIVDLFTRWASGDKASLSIPISFCEETNWHQYNRNYIHVWGTRSVSFIGWVHNICDAFAG